MTRLHSHMEAGFARLDQAMREVKDDVYSLENGVLNRHNEVLEILRRLDESLPAADRNRPDRLQVRRLQRTGPLL